MAQSIEESLLEAIKKDDLKSFDKLTEARLNLRLGRFPVLSLAYLYKSEKIISAHEQMLLKFTSWEEVAEPAAISEKFTRKAGKCLRLYFDEIVSPPEMLLILDRTRQLKRIYPLAKPTSAVKGRLKSIYSIKYGLNVKFENDTIILDKRPLSYREKKNIATACLCSFLAVAVAVGAPVTAVALIPEPVAGEVTKLSQIDFNSRKEYTLKRDISLPENFEIEKFNCTINGGGNKLTVGKNVNLGVLNGSLTDVIINSSGRVFTAVSETAVISSVAVNVNADFTVNANSSFFVGTNSGTIEGVTVNVGGTLNAFAPEAESAQDLFIGGIALVNAYKNSYNYGKIKNCTVNYSDFSLAGETSVNAAIGGIVGTNNGAISGCSVTGNVAADTLDVAGVAIINNGLLSDNKNEANLLQNSAIDEWSPNVGGIVLENWSVIEYCENAGKLSAVSSFENAEATVKPVVIAAGIACLDKGRIVSCVNGGELIAKGCSSAFVGGIAARSYSTTTNCLSRGNISCTADGARVGGIIGFSFVDYYGEAGTAVNCISDCKIEVNATGEEQPFVGGIIGLIQEGSFQGVEEVSYFCGRVNNCYFTGEIVNNVGYSGNIVGVCGANVYEVNSYYYLGKEYIIFENNFYTANLTAFGATVATDGKDDKFTSVEDKGATLSSSEEIINSEGYQNILKEIEKKNEVTS